MSGPGNCRILATTAWNWIEIMKQLVCLMALLWTLAGCGGEAASEAEPANNPLADEQQLIRDAKAVEDMLEEDAEEKRKAVRDMN